MIIKSLKPNLPNGKSKKEVELELNNFINELKSDNIYDISSLQFEVFNDYQKQDEIKESVDNKFNKVKEYLEIK